MIRQYAWNIYGTETSKADHDKESQLWHMKSKVDLLKDVERV